MPVAAYPDRRARTQPNPHRPYRRRRIDVCDSSRRSTAKGAVKIALSRFNPKLRALRRRVLLVLAMFDEIVDHRRVRKCRGIAEASRLVFGDLAQDPAHDLAGAGFRQTGR